MKPPTPPSRHAYLILAGLLFAACDSSPTDPGPLEDSVREMTVDASEGWVFVALGDEASEVQVADPTASTEWDVAFFATAVMLNGGGAGPGGVDGTCLCLNADLSSANLVALTDDAGLDAFEAVTSADVPTDEEAWEGDVLDPAIHGWYSYDFRTHTVNANPDRVFKVRTAGGTSFAKLHVTAITGATQQQAGTVTLAFATQPAAGQPFGETVTLDVDLSGGAVAVDLDAGAIVDTGAVGWDLQLSGYDIRVNGGVSGNGEAGAVVVEEAFETIEDAGDMTAGHYRGDAYGGVFAASDAGRRWYRYNLEGNHQIWPTYNVYLVRSGDEVYKVQLVGYYDPDTGDSRHITFRYGRLE